MTAARGGRPRRRRPGGAGVLLASIVLVIPGALAAQSALGHSPNVRGDWTLGRWETVFVLGHRFEFIAGGDQLINLPTLTLGMGLPARLAMGIDFTSNSEIVADKLGANEAQPWLGATLFRGGTTRLGAIAGYNTAARSLDGALTGRIRFGPVSLLAEGRGFSDALGTGSGGSAAAGGLVLHLTRYLELSADVGRMLDPDTVSSVWSAGVAMAIPGTRHTFALHATNGGATTLQGAARPQVIGEQSIRYGFVFTAPLGSRSQWGRIFRRDPPTEPAGDAAARVEMRMVAFTPREVRIRAGEAVEWVNRDPLEHTVTGDDGQWGSQVFREGQRFRHVFAEPGRYAYHCIPHPQMTGVVIVEARPGGQ